MSVTAEKYIILQTIINLFIGSDKMESFLYNKSEAQSLTDIVRIELCSIRNLEQLFYELSRQTCFPISDWDDLEEFLLCLEGCSSKGVLIEHCDMPQLYKDELCCYLRILQDAAWYWEANEELHRLYYIFPVKDMVLVRTLLEKYYCYDPSWLKQSPIDSISVNKYPHADTPDEIILQTKNHKRFIVRCESDDVTIDITSFRPDAVENGKTSKLDFKWISGSRISHVLYIVDRHTDQYVGVRLILKKNYLFPFYRKHTVSFYHDSDNPKIKHLLVDEPISTDRYYLKDL